MISSFGVKHRIPPRNTNNSLRVIVTCCNGISAPQTHTLSEWKELLMHRLRRSVSSLTALLTFEAAARRESFTRAAGELGVTQAAVSRRMKLLEAEIGRPLFLRANRRVLLTEEGLALFAATSDGFDCIADAIARIRERPADLTVAVSVAFAHFRLLPELSSFRDVVPDANLRVVSSDTWTAPDDPSIDIAVRYGAPPFRGMRVLGSLGEAVVPVCAPSRAGELAQYDIDDLIAGRCGALIEADAPEPTWMGWGQWFTAQGRTIRPTGTWLRFSSYSDGLYAAMAGQGIALGWKGLIERPLGDGRLAALSLPVLTPKERHWILVSDKVAPSTQAEAFASWMERSMGFVP
ncbi:LysR family transcriptional regulator [Loktanella salsilacus]|uniref:LysR family transcriptional regulator n=1 Tax=Loktanella salsilacus TaxID=195913 RepID=UPI003703AEE8